MDLHKKLWPTFKHKFDLNVAATNYNYYNLIA